MNKKLLWIGAFAFTLLFGKTVFADEWQCGDRISKMVSELNLTKDQKDKLKPVVDQFKSIAKDNWSKMKDMRAQMTQQVLSDKMDKTAVNGLVDKKMQLLGNIMKAKADAMNQVFGILDDKQKLQIHDKVKKAEDKMAAKFESCKDE